MRIGKIFIKKKIKDSNNDKTMEGKEDKQDMKELDIDVHCREKTKD